MYKKLILLKLITCSFVNYASSSESNLEEDKRKTFSHITSSPVRYNSQVTLPEGYFQTNEDKLTDVRVQFYLSLGDPLIGKISKKIKQADQFSFAFMYRFSSPILLESFRDKAENSVLFIDRNQCYKDQDKLDYNSFIHELIQKVPTSLIDLKSKSFHQKVIVCKTTNQQAFTIVGSANATSEAENKHSEDVFIIQSNYLAQIFMETFYNLFNVVTQSTKQSEPERLIKIYHKRVIEGFKSNTAYLSHSLTILKEDKSKLNDTFGLKASVSTLAISTGFATGKMNCFDLFKQQIVPDKGNKILVLFQNYLTHDSELFELIKNNDAKKLIILDDNQNNDNSFDQLNELNKAQVLPIKFKNFAEGKFHHKASLQYKTDNTRTVYTGSFNLSKNAIQNNSEYIIGIKNQELPGIFLSTLLKYNSSLNNNPMVWKFISQNPELFDDKIKEQAKRTILDIDQNIRNYDINFFKSIKQLQLKISQKFDDKIISLIESYLKDKSIDYGTRLQTYEALISFILTNELPAHFITDGQYKDKSQSIKKFVREKVDDIMHQVETSKEKMNEILKRKESESSKEKSSNEYMEIDTEESNPNKTEDIESSTLRKEIKNIKESIKNFQDKKKEKEEEKKEFIESYKKIKNAINTFDNKDSLTTIRDTLNRTLKDIFENYEDNSISQIVKLEKIKIKYKKNSSKKEKLNYLKSIINKIDHNINLLNNVTYNDLKNEINILKTNLKDLDELTNILDRIQEIPLKLLDLAKLK